VVFQYIVSHGNLLFSFEATVCQQVRSGNTQPEGISTKFPTLHSVSVITGWGVGVGGKVGLLVGEGKGVCVGAIVAVTVAVAVEVDWAGCTAAGEFCAGAEVALGSLTAVWMGGGVAGLQPEKILQITNNAIICFPIQRVMGFGFR
jgi:hypothetical protein